MPRIHGYAPVGERCFGVQDGRAGERTNAVGALHKRTVLDHLSSQAQVRSGYAANKERKNFVAAWNWAAQYIPGFPVQNPFLVERFSEERTARYVPSEEDFWKVYEQAESEQDRIMLLCFLHLAARRNEIFLLRTEDVDLSGKRVRLYTRGDSRIAPTDYGKNRDGGTGDGV